MNSNPRTELMEEGRIWCLSNKLSDLYRRYPEESRSAIDLLIDSPILTSLYKRCDFSRWPVSVRTVIVITRNNMHVNVGHNLICCHAHYSDPD